MSTSDTEAVIHVTDSTSANTEEEERERENKLENADVAVNTEVEGKEEMKDEGKRMCASKETEVDEDEEDKTTNLRASLQADKKHKKVHWSIPCDTDREETPSLPLPSDDGDKMVLGLHSTDPSSSPLSPSPAGVLPSCQTNLRFSNSLLFDLD